MSPLKYKRKGTIYNLLTGSDTAIWKHQFVRFRHHIGGSQRQILFHNQLTHQNFSTSHTYRPIIGLFVHKERLDRGVSLPTLCVGQVFRRLDMSFDIVCTAMNNREIVCAYPSLLLSVGTMHDNCVVYDCLKL